ncbi:MAG: tellurite resistance TerB family protein, partial [Gammaproteobacteria bacterium]|nr:tellurite resistance TerB family protein [Gammaproteobacteria bacterium]
MKTSGLLDQLLRSGQDLLQKQQSSAGGKPGKGGLSDLLSGVGGGSLGNALSGAGGGALAAGAMGLLLGNRKVRKMGGKAVTYGGLAALGVLAYKAYSNWQAQQGGTQQQTPQTIDRLP